MAEEGYSSRVFVGRDNGLAHSFGSTEFVPDCAVGCILGEPGIG